MRYLRDFASRRDPEGEWMSRVVSFEPVYSESGAMADRRYPVRGTELYKIAGGLAHLLLIDRKLGAYAADSRITGCLGSFIPSQIEHELGLPENTLSQLAERLAAAHGECLLVSENFANQGANGRKLHALTNLLNAVLDSPGNTLDPEALPTNNKQVGPAAIAEAIKKMRSGKVCAVIVAGTNPAFTLPPESAFTEALASVPVKISLADRIDETAGLCDYVLPSLHAAESWNDSEPLAGTYPLQQPLITPIWDNRQLEQSLICIGYACGNKEFAAGETFIQWRDMLKDYWRDNIHPASAAVGDFENWWVHSLQKGVVRMTGTERESEPASFTPEVLAVMDEADRPSGGLELRLGANSIHLDGRSMNNAWLLETLQPVSRVAWDNFITLAPSTAKELGVEDGDVVNLAVSGRNAKNPGAGAAGHGCGRSSH